MSENEEDIKEAIRIILSTSQGERVMRAQFGCSVQEFMFQSTDPTTMIQLESAVRNAIMVWEPRVDEVEVKAEVDREDPGKVMIQVNYRVRSTNNLFNLVYPFYITEGTK
jgi:phage baseplate assembly protein W